MLKGGVIMDVTNAEEARIAEEAGAVAVMALERVPADIRRDGGVARMSDPHMIRAIKQAVTIPVMAKARIGHFVEAQILEALGVDYVDESEVRVTCWLGHLLLTMCPCAWPALAATRVMQVCVPGKEPHHAWLPCQPHRVGACASGSAACKKHQGAHASTEVATTYPLALPPTRQPPPTCGHGLCEMHLWCCCSGISVSFWSLAPLHMPRFAAKAWAVPHACPRCMHRLHAQHLLPHQSSSLIRPPPLRRPARRC